MPIIDIVNGVAKRPIGKTTYGKLIAATILFIGLVSMAGYIADEVKDGDTQTRDTQILLSINNHSNSVLDVIALGVTYAGNILTIAVMTAILAGLIAKMQKWRLVVQVVFTMGGALLLNAILKLIFQRDRPELWQLLTHEVTYSFPSGHALGTAAFATLLVILFWKTRYRATLIIIASVYTISVGLSRLYLGVHYPTDVAAGWLIGIAWAVMIATIVGTVTIKSDVSHQDKE